MKQVTVLGSTGSIGTNTLDVIRAHPDKFQVKALSAHKNAQRLIEQAQEFRPEIVAIGDISQAEDVKSSLQNLDVKVIAGTDGINEVASEKTDITMAAITGMAGLEPTLNAIHNAGQVAFASKECLVSAGSLMMEEVKKAGIDFLPVDSEHNAIFQVFDEKAKAEQGIERLILTASGGPFLDRDVESLTKVTPAEAVKHPNWSMGAKISIDSATMMNKALEVIEARFLFDMPADKIDVLIHPQSIIHSMVEYADGSVLAQLGAPDMRTPISYCLGYPQKLKTPGQRLNFLELQKLEFQEVDTQKFRSVALAYECLAKGQGVCVAFNAVNEVLVEAFLNKKIPYLDIIKNIEIYIESLNISSISSIEDVIALDIETRQRIYKDILNDDIDIKRKA